MYRELTHKMKKREKIFWLAVILLTVFRILLFLTIPIDALANASHDDLLLMQQAQSLMNGEWLGTYCNTTLVKGIVFPLFIAVCNWLCVPYSLGLAGIYLFSVWIFLLAIRNLVRNPYAKGMIWLFLVYSPAMLSNSTQQRAYNISLVPPLILLVIGFCTGLFLRREETIRKLLPWSLGAGVSITAFRFLRDDYIWLFPFVAGALLISLICMLRKKENLRKKLASCSMTVLPFAILFLCTLALKTINLHEYGTFTVNERTDSSFSDVMSDLVQMEAQGSGDQVWVSRDAVEKAMEFSPALGSVRESINKVYESGWATNGEIQGDIIAWALRDAVQDAGYFTDGAASENFFKKVHQELKDAYEKGLYNKKKGIFLSPLSKELVLSEDLIPLLKRCAGAWKQLLFVEKTNVDIFESDGTAQQIRFFEAMTGSVVVYPDNGEITDDPVGVASQRPVVHAQRIVKIYRMLSYLLAALSAACYVLMTADMIMGLRRKKYETWYLWLITTGILGVCAVLITEVSWFTIFLGAIENTGYHYCTGALTLIQFFQIFTIGWEIRRVKNRRAGLISCKKNNGMVK